MVQVKEAEEIIQDVPAPVFEEDIPLQQAVNRVLAEEIRADRDLPPFNRVAMDGFAIDSHSYVAGKSYTITGLQAAGSEPLLLPHANACVEVMTGAMLPGGADAVIPYEQGESNGQTFTPYSHVGVSPWMNIHRKGTDALQHEVLLGPGTVISPAETAVMASVGKTKVKVFGFPPTALISTGNELVPAEARPLPYQVRQSNIPALQTALSSMGWLASVYHLKDDYNEIYTSLTRLLEHHDMLIISGGVSKGRLDYLPRALEALQVEKRFHQVAQKPGKPFWFGCRPDGKVVFALPGNPVSTFLCFYRYIRPWMLRAMQVTPQFLQAELASEVRFGQPLTYFLQVSVQQKDGKLLAIPVAGHGSGDLVNLKNVHGFLELPATENQFNAGQSFPFIPFRPIG